MYIHHEMEILVADGQKYLLLRNKGNFRQPKLVVEARGEQVNRPTKEQGTDEPGRIASGRSGIRSSTEPTDFHQLQEDQFASDIADMLDNLVRGGNLDRLIVVAPPKTLAELRKHYSQLVVDLLVAEIDKDLTKHPVEEIARILSA